MMLEWICFSDANKTVICTKKIDGFNIPPSPTAGTFLINLFIVGQVITLTYSSQSARDGEVIEIVKNTIRCGQ